MDLGSEMEFNILNYVLVYNRLTLSKPFISIEGMGSFTKPTVKWTNQTVTQRGPFTLFMIFMATGKKMSGTK